MTYKHDAVIRAWLDGKPVQQLRGNMWADLEATTDFLPPFYVDREYRIKPEPKPDVVWYVNVYVDGVGCVYGARGEVDDVDGVEKRFGVIKYTIDGETGKLKSAEVV